MNREHAPGISFESPTEEPGVRVVDPIDNDQYLLRTPGPVEPTPTDVDRFAYPVDAATTVRTGAVELPTAVAVYARTGDGAMASSAEHLEEFSLGPGTYTLELLTPVKCYLKVSAPVEVTVGFGETRIEFDGEPEVVIGGRSRRTRPARTVTTTRDPADLLATVSTFGAAMGTTMPERSYPSLRGHPPAVELGEELETGGLSAPATDVHLELPERVSAALTAAPLAYYLGAPVHPSDGARLVADGEAHELPEPGTARFDREVERLLKTVFFMDCLTRYDGAYGHGRRLQERELLTGELGVDFAALYDADHAERVRRYLQIPFETIDPQLPTWKVVTHVTPSVRSIEPLPFLVDDLAIVRMPGTGPDRGRAESGTGSEVGAEAVEAFLPDGGPGGDTARAGGTGFTRGVSTDGDAGDDRDRSFVSPEPADAIEQVWVGDDIPFGASESLLTAYRNRLEREPGDGEIDITVVCNDAAMDDETAVEAVYGQRETLQFDVRLRRNLGTDDLRALLAEDHDFLHYIGHAEPDGLICEDGRLDCGTLAGTGVEAFFFNACRSYDQARALVEAGAIVGIGSHTDVTNASAVGLGRTMARLLERGFPFRAALELARENHPIGEQYVVVGDGGLSITQPESGTAILATVERTASDQFDLTLEGFPTTEMGLGSSYMPYLVQAENTFYLSSGEIDTFELSTSELLEFFSMEPVPVRLDTGISWSDATDFTQL